MQAQLGSICSEYLQNQMVGWSLLIVDEIPEKICSVQFNDVKAQVD